MYAISTKIFRNARARCRSKRRAGNERVALAHRRPHRAAARPSQTPCYDDIDELEYTDYSEAMRFEDGVALLGGRELSAAEMHETLWKLDD